MGSRQGVKVGTLGGQIERNSGYVWLAHTFIFGSCFMSVCLMKSNCYSLIYSSLGQPVLIDIYIKILSGIQPNANSMSALY